MQKQGDAPETKDVHEYEYNGYTIYDTPGLNQEEKMILLLQNKKKKKNSSICYK